MTDIEWALTKLQRIRDDINSIANLASIEPVSLSEKTRFFDKLSEMDRTVDILMDMTKVYFCKKVSGQPEQK